MDNDMDEKVVETKTLDEFDQSTDVSVGKGESDRVDMTNSTSMDAIVHKSQENGSGVEEQESVLGNSVNGGAGAEDGMSVAEEFPTAKNAGVEKVMGEENVADGGEIEKGSKEIDNGEKKDGFLDGSVDSSEKPSSISRRTRNSVKIEGFEEEDANVVGKDNGGGDEVDEENPFSVGDFVWGKIKSHPWWPGRIYDSSDASEFALKFKHEGRLLVAYFGDRTFAWCDPSQLKSFQENFEEMSKQSSLKTFVSAVEEAENEFGRLVKLQMTCSCAKAKESQSFTPFVVNGGVKEGVLVPEKGTSISSAAHFESSTMLADIRRLALFDSVCNSLEQTVVKTLLSAFYDANIAKYGYSLTINCEPMSIEDAMDERAEPEEASLRGPDDGQSNMGPEVQEPGQNVPKTPLDVEEEGRKSKTIADLLGGDLEDELEGNGERTGETPVGKSVVKSRKKRKKISDEQLSMPEVTGNNDSSEVEEQPGKQVEKSRKRKRKTLEESQRHVADNTRVTRSSSQKKTDPVRSTTSKKEISKDTKGGGETRNLQKIKTVPHVRKKGISLSINGDPSIEEGYERISPRERKLSKYLSPPYTNILQRQRSSSSLLGSDQDGDLAINDDAKTGERMTKAAGDLVGSPPIVKCSAQTFQKSSKSSGSKREKTEHSDHKTSKPDPSSEVDDPMKNIGPLKAVVREICSAARNPLDSKRHQSFDSVKVFVSAYRSSKYKNGPNYKSFKKRARFLSGTKHGSNSNRKAANEVDQQTPKPKPLKRSATKRDELKPESEVDHEASCKPSSALLITFPAGFSLPTKEEVVEMFRKFGDLHERKTKLVPESSMAKIVFLQSTSAEAAMDSIRKSSPFGSVKISCKIQPRARGSASKRKTVDVQNKKKTESSKTIKEAKSNEPEREPLAVIFIKQKLEAMTAMLGQTDGKMTPEIKSKLENESKELLKKVKMMTGTSS